MGCSFHCLWWRGWRLRTPEAPKTLPVFASEALGVGPANSDELMSYGLLTGDGYKHGQVKHSEKDWAHYDYRLREVVSTNQVENFWRLFKHALRSTHTSVSKQHMIKYLAEFTFRANHRDQGNAMLDVILRAM